MSMFSWLLIIGGIAVMCMYVIEVFIQITESYVFQDEIDQYISEEEKKIK